MKIKNKEGISIPSHTQPVIVVTSDGLMLPAIYYNNESFKGFYKFTSFYQDYKENGLYSKVYLKDKHRINDVIDWCEFPKEIIMRSILKINPFFEFTNK